MNDPYKRRYDAAAFARRLAKRMRELAHLSDSEAARQAGVTKAAFSRARHGEPNLSHENVLRLQAWLDAGDQAQGKSHAA